MNQNWRGLFVFCSEWSFIGMEWNWMLSFILELRHVENIKRKMLCLLTLWMFVKCYNTCIPSQTFLIFRIFVDFFSDFEVAVKAVGSVPILWFLQITVHFYSDPKKTLNRTTFWVQKLTVKMRNNLVKYIFLYCFKKLL